MLIPRDLKQNFVKLLGQRPLPKDNIFRFNWYVKEATLNGEHILIYGMKEFGYLALDNFDLPPDELITSEISLKLPMEYSYHVSIDEKPKNVSWDIYSSIPNSLNQRLNKAAKIVQQCSHLDEALERIGQLNQESITLDKRTVDPEEALNELFESLADAFDIYCKEKGLLRTLWNNFRGARPWLIAYYSVLLGFSYEDALLRDKSNDDARIMEYLNNNDGE